MVRNSYLKTYADARVGVNGLLYKAGLTELADTEAGYGRGYDGAEWLTPGAATIVNGGMRAPSGAEIFVIMPDGGGGVRADAIREAFMHRGAFQIKMHVSDLGSIGTSAVEIIRAYSTAGSTNGPIYMSYSNPAIASNAYNQVVTDYDGNRVFTNPGYAIGTSNVIANIEWPQAIIHDGDAGEDGYVIFGVDWSGNWERHFINGYLVAENAKDSWAGEFTHFALQRTTAQVSMKELLLYDRPFERHNKVDCRVSLIGHSYVARQNLKRKSYDNGTIGGLSGGSFPWGATEALNTALQRYINAEVDIFSTGYSGQDLAYQEDRIINGTPTAFAVGSGNDQDQVTRHRPQFCVMFGNFINDVGTASLTLRTSVHDISVALMAQGIIPVWCIEWDNIALTATAEQEYIEAEADRQQAINDMGVIKGSVEFGADAEHTYSAYEASGERHPNFKGQDKWALHIAEEINRLLLDPPNYSKLAGGNGEYQSIAVPT